MKPLAVYPAAYVGVAFKHTIDHLCLQNFFHIYLPLKMHLTLIYTF